jgi:hypothetical protein
MGNGGIVRFIRLKLRICDGFLLQSPFSGVTIHSNKVAWHSGPWYYWNLYEQGGSLPGKDQSDKEVTGRKEMVVVSSKVKGWSLDGEDMAMLVGMVSGKIPVFLSISQSTQGNDALCKEMSQFQNRTILGRRVRSILSCIFFKILMDYPPQEAILYSIQ